MPFKYLHCIWCRRLCRLTREASRMLAEPRFTCTLCGSVCRNVTHHTQTRGDQGFKVAPDLSNLNYRNNLALVPARVWLKPPVSKRRNPPPFVKSAKLKDFIPRGPRL